MKKRTIFYVLALLVLVGSCSDEPLNSNLPDDEQKELTAQQRSTLMQAQSQREAISRWDAPWWGMSNKQMADSLQKTDGEVIISFKAPGTNAGVANSGRVLLSDQAKTTAIEIITGLGVEILRRAQLHPSVLAKIPVDLALINALRNHPRVDIFEPNVKGRWTTEITWNVDRVNAPDVWSQTTGTGAKLLIIDSGVSNTHNDLNPTVIQACDSSNGVDQIGHGTHVSGIAVALQNSQDVVGVAHGVELWSSKTGTSAPTAFNVECAIEFGRINNVDVMNMSLGVTQLSTLTDEINAAYNQDDIVLVASAGNTSGGSVSYPANLSEVIAVTATDINDNRASFAAIGPEIELSAPGVDIESTSLSTGSVCTQGSDTGLCSGTSMAAPHVAGAAALLRANDPSLSNVDIRNLLNNNTQTISGTQNEVGNGLLDIAAAISITPSLSVTITGPYALDTGV